MGKNKYLENVKVDDIIWLGNEFGDTWSCVITENAKPSTRDGFTNLWLKYTLHHPQITTWQEVHLICEAKKSYSEYTISHVHYIFSTNVKELDKRIKHFQKWKKKN